MPDYRLRVRRLLGSIIITYAPSLDATSSLGLEYKGVIDNFEKSAALLLARGPVTKCENTSSNANSDDIARASEA